jgi:hypothetical protein
LLAASTRLDMDKLMVGRWRKIPPETKQKIMQGLKMGRRSVELEREFGVCANTIIKMRRLIGDIPKGAGRPRKLSGKVLQIAEERLRRGERWRNVAASLAVSPQTLANRLAFRKRKRK